MVVKEYFINSTKIIVYDDYISKNKNIAEQNEKKLDSFVETMLNRHYEKV